MRDPPGRALGAKRNRASAAFERGYATSVDPDETLPVLFTSLAFVVFFLVVYGLYLIFQKSYKIQNAIIVVASYIFYGFWDYRFCGVLALTTFVNFYIARAIAASDDDTKRKRLCVTGVTLSLTMLGCFKYFMFFEAQFLALLALFGLKIDPLLLHVVLPVGMSFYTFKEISYVVDVYRRKLEPEPNPFNFAMYVSFFPQLVAGPIERAGEMLPYIRKPRKITAADVDEGVYLIIWGLFKKLYVADNMAVFANDVFDNYHHRHGIDLYLAVVAYAFQIYGDFSGYTDIARGVARLMGFHLPINFRLPYFAASPGEFWQRWHITLSQWLRDYLYIPLGGNRGGSAKTNRNLMITMFLGGLWHGAAWNFIFWGGYHGLLQVLYRVFGKEPKTDAPVPAWRQGLSIFGMFQLTLLGWLFFRARSLDQILYFLSHMSVKSGGQAKSIFLGLIQFAGPLVLAQIWMQRKQNLLVLMQLRGVARLALYTVIFLLIALYGQRSGGEFIYFQF